MTARASPSVVTALAAARRDVPGLHPALGQASENRSWSDPLPLLLLLLRGPSVVRGPERRDSTTLRVATAHETGGV